MNRRLGRRTIILLLALLLLTGLSAHAADEWYRVQADDSIQSIASHFGIPAQALLNRNNLIEGESLSRGQILRIPASSELQPTYQVVATDSLRSIATRYGITVEALMAENNIFNESHLIPGQTLFLPESAADRFVAIHIVQPRETLDTIAKLYGIDWQTLALVNNLSNPNLIRAYQDLLVPEPAQAGTPSALLTQLSALEVHEPGPQLSPIQRIYIAQAGDSVENIAQRFVVPLQDLRSLNGFRGEIRLYAGDMILLPPDSAFDAQLIGTPAADEIRHIVRYGETLGAIAASYGRNIWDIANDNSLLNPHLLYVGQVLIIR